MFAPEDQRSTMMAEEGDEGLKIKGKKTIPSKTRKTHESSLVIFRAFNGSSFPVVPKAERASV
jgi:hypothetical protein